MSDYLERIREAQFRGDHVEASQLRERMVAAVAANPKIREAARMEFVEGVQSEPEKFVAPARGNKFQLDPAAIRQSLPEDKRELADMLENYLAQYYPGRDVNDVSARHDAMGRLISSLQLRRPDLLPALIRAH